MKMKKKKSSEGFEKTHDDSDDVVDNDNSDNTVNHKQKAIYSKKVQKDVESEKQAKYKDIDITDIVSNMH
jgi:hypothetical protein